MNQIKQMRATNSTRGGDAKDTKEIIRNMQTNKTARDNRIQTEIIKHGRELMESRICNLIKKSGSSRKC